ncbi:hypothetical protein COY95_00760, partial [Candidatus Woesearchaeota archaeon CG_4_10_14_0_8_um_filter_47_5]
MVKVMFVEGRWEGEIALGSEVLAYLEKRGVRNIALFSSVQFLKLETVRAQLSKAGIEVRTTRARRAWHAVQLLGCDADPDSFDENVLAESDIGLYVGDGMFHPKALLLCQRTKREGTKGKGTKGGGEVKDIVIWNPVARAMSIMTRQDMKKEVMRLSANLKRFIAAQTIGILVSLKPGQEFLRAGEEL